jgi:uncharacterized protein
MRERIVAIAGLFILLAGACIGQSTASSVPAANPDAASKEQIMRFLDLMQIRTRMVQMMDGMKVGMKNGAEAGLKQEIPNPSPEQLAKVDLVADTIFKEFPIDEMIDAMIPIYQRHLTKADLDAIVAFYSSPAGQRLLKEQPAMMAEGMKVGQDIMLKKVPELTQRLNAEVDRIGKEEAKKTPATPPKQP